MIGTSLSPDTPVVVLCAVVHAEQSFSHHVHQAYLNWYNYSKHCWGGITPEYQDLNGIKGDGRLGDRGLHGGPPLPRTFRCEETTCSIDVEHGASRPCLGMSDGVVVNAYPQQITDTDRHCVPDRCEPYPAVKETTRHLLLQPKRSAIHTLSCVGSRTIRSQGRTKQCQCSLHHNACSTQRERAFKCGQVSSRCVSTVHSAPHRNSPRGGRVSVPTIFAHRESEERDVTG